MWTPVKTVGLEEYLEAENGPLWYQQIAKSKLGAPDIEFARIGTYVREVLLTRVTEISGIRLHCPDWNNFQ